VTSTLGPTPVLTALRLASTFQGEVGERLYQAIAADYPESLHSIHTISGVGRHSRVRVTPSGGETWTTGGGLMIVRRTGADRPIIGPTFASIGGNTTTPGRSAITRYRCSTLACEIDPPSTRVDSSTRNPFSGANRGG